MASDNVVPVKASHGAQVILTGKARDAARGAVAPDIVGNSNAKAEVLGGHFDGAAPRERIEELDPPDGSVLEQKMLDAAAPDVAVSPEDDIAVLPQPDPQPAVAQPPAASAPKAAPAAKG